MYKRQIYQIAESNRKKNRFGSENRIESKTFCPNWNALVNYSARTSIPMISGAFVKYSMPIFDVIMTSFLYYVVNCH